MGTRSWNSSRNKSDGTSAKMGESGFSTKYAAKRKYNPLEHNIKQFVCNICNKKFTTFQALGGHRSVHNSKGLPVKEARDDAKGRREIDFDLNQLPDEDGAA